MHTVTVLHVPGCVGGGAALRIASRLAAERSDVTVEDGIVESQGERIRLGFRASPTVLVDGRDVEPDARTPLGSMG